MRTQRMIPLVAAVVVLVAGVAVLGMRTISGADNVAARAYGALADSESYRFSTTTDVVGPGGRGEGAGVRLEGAADVRSGLFRFEMMLGTARCVYVGSDDEVFVSVHPSRRQQLGGAWIKTDPRAAAAFGGVELSPERLARADDAFSDLRQAGRAVVRGTATTRYRGRVDLSSFTPSATDDPTISRAARSATAELYVDDDDRIRRQVVETGGGGFRTKVTMDFYAFDEPVKIVKPPANAAKAVGANDAATACFPVVPARPPAT